MPRQAATPDSRSSALRRRTIRSGVTPWIIADCRYATPKTQLPTPKASWRLGIGGWEFWFYDSPKLPPEPVVPRSPPNELTPLPALPLQVLPELPLALLLPVVPPA